MSQRAERKKIQKANNKTQGKKVFAARKSVLNNADNLCKNGEKMIDSFRSEKNEAWNLEVDISKYSDSEPKASFEESISERRKIRRQEESDAQN